MSTIPGNTWLDRSLALALDPFHFIRRGCERYGTDLFKTRLMLEPTLCMRGEQAARLFYDNERFERRGAAPPRLLKTLFGEGGVQGLDGAAHRVRKELFVGLMSPERVRALAQLTAQAWDTRAGTWLARRHIVLYREAAEVFCASVCEWAGVPLAAKDVPRRTREFIAMIEGAGSAGPRHWMGRRARASSEAWIAGLVRQVRSGRLSSPADAALAIIARHRDVDDHLLDERIAAVEVINILRPTVAIAVLVVLSALAMHEHPECRQRLTSDPQYLDDFVQEVRRYYPFFPIVAARVREDFHWNGYRFPKGWRTLLDLHGTDQDARSWPAAESFEPDRFRTWNGSPYNFIPQGGGEHRQHHRCPGEWITIELTKVAVDFLARSLSYDVPSQKLAMRRLRLPTIPRSGFVIDNVRMSNEPARVLTPTRGAGG